MRWCAVDRDPVAEPSTKARAWAIFDRIVGDAAPEGEHSNPWFRDGEELVYEPDLRLLERLLGVPLALTASTTTGVPALALDVWLSYELRRAGFDGDAIWPRPKAPRVLPAPIAALLKLRWSKGDREAIERKVLARTPPKDVVASSANILGKNYMKQVDVVMSDWATGPELLISTKRMDSSFGKNAANRVEESYGDAKNLRLRHPLAALGFVYGLRTTIFEKESEKAAWLADLLQKLGREDDAYNAVALIMIEYDDRHAVPEEADSVDAGDDSLEAAGVTVTTQDEDDTSPESVEVTEVERVLADLPPVVVREDLAPSALSTARFLERMVERVLDATPVNVHEAARSRRNQAPQRPVADPHLPRGATGLSA